MARAHRKKPPLTPERIEQDNQTLADIAEATESIRFSQDSILAQSKIRTEMVLEARSRGISYRAIAGAMRTSEQTVYKIVKPFLGKGEKGKNDL